jgi:DNA-binding GntR family transcriptional regulator
MTTVEPLDRRSSGDHAALYIKRLIFDQKLRAGDRIPQDEVAQALGISRIPVREALIALEREGWISIEVHRGAFVTDLDEFAVRDHYTMYGLIYAFAARRALDRVDDPIELADRLDAIVAELGTTDDPVTAARVAVAFHQAIVEPTRSPRIQTILGAMSRLLPGNFFAEVPGAIPVERKGLTAIARAIRRADRDAATRGYENMMRKHGDLVVELLTSRGFFSVDPSA